MPTILLRGETRSQTRHAAPTISTILKALVRYFLLQAVSGSVLASWQRVVGAPRSVLDFQDKMRSLCPPCMGNLFQSRRTVPRFMRDFQSCLLAGYIRKS